MRPQWSYSKSDWLMIAFITCKSSLVPLLEVLCTSNPCRTCTYTALNFVHHKVSITFLSAHFGISSIYQKKMYIRTQSMHSKRGYIFWKPYFFCVAWKVSQLSQVRLNFRVYMYQGFLCMRPQWLHSKSENIFEKSWFFNVEWSGLLIDVAFITSQEIV